MIRPALRRVVAIAVLIVPALVLAELPQVRDARVPAPPPGAPVAAAYMTLVNPGDEVLRVTGASSPDVPRVEMHRSSIVDEVARMERQEALEVPPGDELVLARGGLHLMLTGLSERLEPGDSVRLRLETSAGPLDLTLPVEPIEGMNGHGSADDGDAARHGGAMEHDGGTK